MTVMRHDPNIANPQAAPARAIFSIPRSAESFYDRCITDAAGRAKPQTMKDDVHTIRIAGIHNRSFAVGRAATQFGSEGQLQWQSDPESATCDQLCPGIMPLGVLPR